MHSTKPLPTDALRGSAQRVWLAYHGLPASGPAASISGQKASTDLMTDSSPKLWSYVVVITGTSGNSALSAAAARSNVPER